MKIRVYFVSILLIAAFLSSCGKGAELGEKDDTSLALSKKEVHELLDSVSLVPENRYNEWDGWDEDDSGRWPLDKCVRDEETALDIGGVLLNRYQEDGFFSEYTLQLIEYQEGPGGWMITYGKENDSNGTDATVRFFIRRDNAQVEKIWIGEEEYDLSRKEGETADLIEPCIPDAETALQYGNALLQQYQRDGYFPRYIPQMIEYQEDPLIWIICYWEDLGPDALSATVSFAFYGKDGQVICIWSCEG
ncbi:MAG: hypothetical protein IJK63_08300 [Oscillospiraceae bacterium]|nr:hypothetical protein [Oscillospiraceae bacterium]